jgi:hypothetical protein
MESHAEKRCDDRALDWREYAADAGRPTIAEALRRRASIVLGAGLGSTLRVEAAEGAVACFERIAVDSDSTPMESDVDDLAR